eukprot:8650538-Heterocapsa_arctica.AAC.1
MVKQVHVSNSRGNQQNPIIPKPGNVRWVSASELDLPTEGAVLPVVEHLSKLTLHLWTNPEELVLNNRPGPTPETAMLITDLEFVNL